MLQRVQPVHPSDDAEAFAREVGEGLRRRPRRLAPHYLYDDLGSSLFEAICRLPWYPVTRAEKALLGAHGREIASVAGCPVTLIELGCGTGEKLEILIGAFGRPARGVRVVLIDVSTLALERSSRLVAALGTGPVVTCRATYEVGLAKVARERAPGERRLVLFLGSNLGNLEPRDAVAFLSAIRGALGPGDHLLLGVDLVKPRPVLERAYDDPLGVTAAFNRNLLVRLNRELEADFDVEAFGHRAAWNPRRSRVDMFLVSRRRQVVHIPAAGAFPFEVGDTIWTESSYKYTPGRLAMLCRRAAFERRAQWIEDDAHFALNLLEAVDPVGISPPASEA